MSDATSSSGEEKERFTRVEVEPAVKLRLSESGQDMPPLVVLDHSGPPDEPPYQTPYALAYVPPEVEVAKEKSPQETLALLKRLPTLIPIGVIAFLFWNEPILLLASSYFYWMFSAYRTAKVVREVFGAKNVSSMNVLIMAQLPIVILISSYVMFLGVRFLNFSGPAVQYYNWSALLISILGLVYQFKWPISCSIAVRKKSEGQDIWPGLPGYVVHFLTGLSFNLLPLVSIGFGAVMFAYPFLRDAPVMWAAYALAVAFCQYLGFFLLKRRLYSILSRTDPAFAHYLQRAREVEPKVSDDDIIVRYRAFAEYERWFKHRFREKSSKKAIFLFVTLTLFLALGAPQWCLQLLTQLPGIAGVAPTATNATSVSINFLNVFQALLLGFLGGAGLVYMSKPTHVGFSKKGMRFLWRHKVFNKDGRYIRWDAFQRIRIFMPKGKTSPADQHLLFETGSKTGPERDMELKLSSIIRMDDKERILRAIEGYAPGVERDASVLQALQPPADHSYTELWLQALSAPPKRERFKPLSEGAKLNDGRFKVAGQLGVGGQGTAYLAYDLHTSSSVVLKEFILPVYVDVTVRKQALERFENEARILKQLDHDQVVKLIDYFVEDHRSYLVLEHIDGQSLKQVVEETGKLTEERVIELARQMIEILKYLHGLVPPVVHRDFTPDNLILRKDGKLKLVDFNVAQQTDSTATGTVVGKHAYLPPEQFRGTPVPQSDLYALGATLHYLLTAVEPEPISVSRPGKINSEVSEAMDLFVAKATAMTLEARHQNVEELADELNAFFMDEPS